MKMNMNNHQFNTYILIKIQVYSCLLLFKLADKTNSMQKAIIATWPKFVSNIYLYLHYNIISLVYLYMCRI